MCYPRKIKSLLLLLLLLQLLNYQGNRNIEEEKDIKMDLKELSSVVYRIKKLIVF